MKWLGLTGGMGCGKSEALNIFKALDLGTVSADQVVHSLYQKEEVRREVSDTLGIESTNFQLADVAKIVFSDQAKLTLLESVLHPKVRTEIEKIKNEFEGKGYKAAIYEVPLLFEKNMEGLFDAIICIGASYDVQFQRIKERNDWTDAEIQSRLSNQLPLEEKAKRADFYIDNSGSLEELAESCRSILDKINS